MESLISGGFTASLSGPVTLRVGEAWRSPYVTRRGSAKPCWNFHRVRSPDTARRNCSPRRSLLTSWRKPSHPPSWQDGSRCRGARRSRSWWMRPAADALGLRGAAPRQLWRSPGPPGPRVAFAAQARRQGADLAAWDRTPRGRTAAAGRTAGGRSTASNGYVAMLRKAPAAAGDGHQLDTGKMPRAAEPRIVLLSERRLAHDGDDCHLPVMGRAAACPSSCGSPCRHGPWPHPPVDIRRRSGP